MDETVTTTDGRVLDKADLIEDEDGHWERMGGALALVAPSAAYEARREADAAATEKERVAREAVAAEEAAIQAELRAMAIERLAAKG